MEVRLQQSLRGRVLLAVGAELAAGLLAGERGGLCTHYFPDEPASLYGTCCASTTGVYLRDVTMSLLYTGAG